MTISNLRALKGIVAYVCGVSIIISVAFAMSVSSATANCVDDCNSSCSSQSPVQASDPGSLSQWTACFGQCVAAPSCTGTPSDQNANAPPTPSGDPSSANVTMMNEIYKKCGTQAATVDADHNIQCEPAETTSNSGSQLQTDDGTKLTVCVINDFLQLISCLAADGAVPFNGQKDPGARMPGTVRGTPVRVCGTAWFNGMVVRDPQGGRPVRKWEP